MERREVIKSLFQPELLREHPKYKVLVEAVARELGRTGDSIEILPILGSPELMPKRYLPLLCDLFGIEYNYNKSDEAHREILKRIFEARSNRGSQSSIRKNAARAVDTDFYIEDLTYYNKKIQEQPVNFYPAHNRIFRYSVSKASGNHYLEDGTSWDMGLLVVEVEDWTTRVQEKVYSVLPAGRLIWVHMFVTLVGGEALILTPYESWDVQTGERVLSNYWPGPGEYGEVGYPQGECGMTRELVFDLGTKSIQSPTMIYSVRGLLSGAVDGEGGEFTRTLLSGGITGRKEFEREFDIWGRSHYNGNADADVGGDDLVGMVYQSFDGFYLDDETTFVEWTGGIDEDVQGGDFKVSKDRVLKCDGLNYKS